MAWEKPVQKQHTLHDSIHIHPLQNASVVIFHPIAICNVQKRKIYRHRVKFVFAYSWKSLDTMWAIAKLQRIYEIMKILGFSSDGCTILWLYWKLKSDTFSRWIIWYMNYISIKLQRKYFWWIKALIVSFVRGMILQVNLIGNPYLCSKCFQDHHFLF